MITQLEGFVASVDQHSFTLNVQGVFYEINAAESLLKLTREKSPKEPFNVIIYHYIQTEPSRSLPVLVGFQNAIEREFFEKFITVSGVGPKAALKAFAVPISHIASAIDAGDRVFLKTLPGVGEQRAREIIAKLQGKVGRFCLLRDGDGTKPALKSNVREEALAVLAQLQYRRQEAEVMVDEVLRKNSKLGSVEDILNEVYRQKSDKVAHAG